MSVFLQLLGLALIVYSIKIFWQFQGIEPVGIFNFEDATNEFEIQLPGYYAISILGAGSIHETEKIVLQLLINTNQILEVNTNAIATRFRNDGKIGTEYWGFTTADTGPCVLTITNTARAEAKESMLISKRMFEDPIDHKKLKLLIYPTIRPLYKISRIISLVLGVNLIVIGIVSY